MMASEVAESSSSSSSSSSRRMDLNLYLGLSPLPRPRGRDIGLDLALACLSPPTPHSPRLEEIHDPLAATAADSVYPVQYAPSDSFPMPEQLPIDTLLAFDIEYGALALEGPNDDSVNAIQPAVLPFDASSNISSPLPHVGVSLPPLTEMVADELPVPGGSTHGPRLLSSSPASAIRLQESEAANSTRQMVPNPLRILATTGDSQEQQEACLELRLQRLIQVSNRYDIGRLPDRRAASPETDRLIGEIMHSQSCLEASRKRKLGFDGKIVGGGDCECGADFECNICFDTAKEPVVTPCGHLFCWPCLFQWLHRHSEHSECPVCKGEVFEVNVTPIYGRGGGGERDNSSSDVPPRPHAQRNEGLRQQLQRTSLRRSGENLPNMIRTLQQQQQQQQQARVEGNGNGNGNAHIPARFDAVHPFMLPRMIRNIRFRRQREERSGARGNVQGVWPPRQETPNTSDSGSQESGNNQPFPSSIVSDAPRRAPQPSSSADRTSTSSTMAVIEGDVAPPMDDLAEPNIAASSAPTRSRRRRVQ